MSIENKIKEIIGPSQDYIFKNITIDKTNILLIFNETLINSVNTDHFILKYLLSSTKKDFSHLEDIIPNTNILKINKDKIIKYLELGFIIINIKNYFYAVEQKENLYRGVPTIESELSLTGPKDSFTENYNTNVGLIRRRIKSTDLYIENIEIGNKTKTKIGIAHVEGIANNDLVNKIKTKLSKINIDGIIDSSYLKKSLEEKHNMFPTLIVTERPDKTCMSLLEGKIVIIVDMSPYVIILPSLFIDFFHTTDDYYQKSINTTFIRIIRLFALLVATFTPAIYLVITTRNYDLVPLPLLLTLKAGRTFVPFPAYLEALFMIICFEILKESDLRMSSTTGSSISILGGLILGDAAVSAGIVSPIMIIVIAISSIASLTFQSIELNNALRNYKIILLVLSTLFGINGLLIGTTILIYNLMTLKPYGIPYLTPLIPFDRKNINDAIVKVDNKEEKRNSYLTNNTNRGNYK